MQIVDYRVNWTELTLYIDISVIHEFLIEKLEKKDQFLNFQFDSNKIHVPNTFANNNCVGFNLKFIDSLCQAVYSTFQFPSFVLMGTLVHWPSF